MIHHAPALVFRAVVAVPVDMGRGWLLYILVYGFQPNGVSIFRILWRASSTFRSTGICLKNSEGLTRKNGNSCIFIIRSTPLLHDPLLKAFCISICRFRCGASSGGRGIYVELSIRRSRTLLASFSYVFIIDYVDAISAFQRGAPLSIQVKPFVDPETIAAVVAGDIGVPGSTVAPTIHHIRKVSFLVIRGCIGFVDLG